MSGKKHVSPPTGPGSRGELADDAIREQLDRILASREFHATARMRDFLRFVVEETLAGRSDQLKGCTIATAVFGRDRDFDPGLDPIVRIQAGKLRRGLERYYLVAGREDPIRIDIPKGRYVPFFVEQPRSASGASADPVPESSVGGATPSVAAMPFDNLTGDTEQDYFVDGLLSELTVELGRYQDIIAIPSGGAEPAPNDPKNAKAAGSRLGARFLLGGTLRTDAERAKVTLQLTDTATGRQVWSEACDIPDPVRLLPDYFNLDLNAS
jgi:adenylate cyclase